MYTYNAKVVAVHDGDTFKAILDLGFSFSAALTFRMQGINAPELKKETIKDGIASRDRLRELILNKDVVLKSFKPDTSLKQEKYGRFLARVYVTLDNGTELDVNSDMIYRGLAVPFLAD